MRKLTQEEVIEKFKTVHGDKYDYSGVVYKGYDEKIEIKCNIHDVFEQTPSNHIKGSGCPHCAIMKQTYTQEQIIERFKFVHDDRYDYSLVKYIGSHLKIKIICNVHEMFEQTPDAHLNQKQGCPKCCVIQRSIKNTSTTDKFISEAIKIHGDKYDYSLVNYIKKKLKVKIICREHGMFEQTPDSHTNGEQGCKICGIKQRTNSMYSTTEIFISEAIKIHGDKYDYSLVNYIRNNLKVKIICKVHGVFEQIPNSHLSSNGCVLCWESKSEKTTATFLEKNDIDYIREHKFDTCKGKKQKLPFDFYLPDTNICIELDGIQHYIPRSFGCKDPVKVQQTFENIQRNDKIKTDYCMNNGIKLIRIPYTDFDRIEEILREELLYEIKI